VTYDTAMAYLPPDVDRVGTSLGSFSLSAPLLMALMEEFAAELRAKSACLDSDPHFWMPLSLKKEGALPPPPSIFWEVARTVVAPPSSVVKCLWEVFGWGFGVLFLSCACVCRCRGCCSLSVCVCVTFYRRTVLIPSPTSSYPLH